MCETLVVNAHGGLLMLRHEVDDNEMLVLVNPETQEQQLASLQEQYNALLLRYTSVPVREKSISAEPLAAL